MIFKFLEKPITITAYASELFYKSCEEFPIAPSSKFIPDWWKKCPKSKFDFSQFEEKLTVKSCVGIMGTFQNGYTLPLWTDLAIQTDENQWRCKFSDGKSQMHNHSSPQIPNFYENYHTFKAVSPWILKSSCDIKYCFVHPFYTIPNPVPYIIPYGITSSLKKTTATNVFFFFEKKPLQTIIEAGTPLVQIIPLTEKKIIFKREIVSREDFGRLNIPFDRILFTSSGLKTITKQGD